MLIYPTNKSEKYNFFNQQAAVLTLLPLLIFKSKTIANEFVELVSNDGDQSIYRSLVVSIEEYKGQTQIPKFKVRSI